MTVEEMRTHARRLVADWPALSPDQRLRLAVVLRPDLPVGIQSNRAGGGQRAA